MHERTGGQTAVGMINIVFGLMGIALSALLIALGPAIAADMARPHQGVGVFIMKLPTYDAFSLGLELAMLTAWCALVITGFGVLRLEQWSTQACIACGAAICFLSMAKLIDGGFNYIALGFVAYGALLAGICARSDWRIAFAAARGQRHVHDELVDADALAAERRAA